MSIFGIFIQNQIPVILHRKIESRSIINKVWKSVFSVFQSSK